MNIKGTLLSVGLHAALLIGVSVTRDQDSRLEVTPIRIRVSPSNSRISEEIIPEEIIPEEIVPRPIPEPVSQLTPVPTPKTIPNPKPSKSKPTGSKPVKRKPTGGETIKNTRKPIVKLDTLLSNNLEGKSGSNGTEVGTGIGTGKIESADTSSALGSSNRRESASCNEVASQPKPLIKTEIPYPKQVRQRGIQGQLVLRLRVDPQGKVTRVKVLRSLSAHADMMAVEAVRNWKFRPAQACGKAVASDFTVARRFELGG